MELKSLSYNELLLLAESNDFYNIIKSREDVSLYLSLLHKAYCKENNFKTSKIIYSDCLENNVYACYDYKDHNIYFNLKLIEIYEMCKSTKNTFYPYVLIFTTIHESRHSWQHINLKKMFKPDTSYREKLALYSILKKKEEIKNLPSVNRKKHTIKDDLNLLRNIFLSLELNIEYSNCPSELDAEEEAIKALMYIYETTLTENSLNILLNYANRIKENDGLWFLSHEYYEDKDNGRDKKSFEVIKEVYMNYLKLSIEEHKKGNHNFTEEHYVFSLFPNLNKLITVIRKYGKVPEISSDSKEISRLFSNNQKSLPPKR